MRNHWRSQLPSASSWWVLDMEGGQKKTLAFGIEAILAPGFARSSKKNFDLCLVKQEDGEEEDDEEPWLSPPPFRLPYSLPFSCQAGSPEEDKRSGSTSPTPGEQRRPLLPFLLPNSLTLRKHRYLLHHLPRL